jgi:hypothetical protein
MKLDVIVLSLTKDDAHFQMTKKCVESYLQSGKDHINNIIIVESNKQFDASKWRDVSSKIKSVTPPYNFNYNQFLNIGLKHCASDMICISNSDVVVQKDCISKMMHFFNTHPEAASASPVDRNWHQNSYSIFPKDDEVYWGYQTTKYLLGFCIFMRQSVYDVIGAYDERFDFYHQDNDYEMCLKSNNLKHAMVTSCHIKHGDDKPDDGVTHEETLCKLRGSESLFLRKWNSSKFKKFKKLSFITSVKFEVCDDAVEIVEDISNASGQYVTHIDKAVTIDEQQHILHMLGYTPTQLRYNSIIVDRKF